MTIITNENGIETLIFAETFEYEAYDQIKQLCNFEAYNNSKIRIMPDAHAGKGCTVGTTLTITNKVTPNLVGVDIGCGMLTIKLKNTEIDLKKLDDVINTYVPSGFNIHSKNQKDFDINKLRCFNYVDTNRAMLSIGTLGGGNHFVELSKSKNDGSLFLIIHSGSRKLGGDVCKYYQDLAYKNKLKQNKEKLDIINKLKSENKTQDIQVALEKFKSVKTNKDLAYLEGLEFDNYMHDMSLVQQFASLNRQTIADIICKEMLFIKDSSFETIHNYIDFNRMILRKGAVSAELDELFLVPINMHDGSLLCIGKGNSEWNYSAPHGAGRLMSRSKAKESLDMDEFINSMKDIYSTSVLPATLDEAPKAYKSIEEITSAIKDTADIVDILKPIYNYKSH